jgi:hypothetical protein
MSKNNLVASAREMLGVGPIVYPPKFHKFFKNQKSKSRELTHTEDSRMVWVVGSNLITKKKTFIPKQMTSWFSE